MGNYDPSMKGFADAFIGLDPDDLEFAGIYADKPGYHNKRSQLPSTDYSVAEFEIDRQGPSTNASAVDITSKSAVGGNYSIINKYSKRLIAAGEAHDPRVAGWREFFGQTDSDKTVEGWDFAKKRSSTSADLSHDWHIHLSEHRGYTTSMVNKEAMISVLKGETLDAYKARGGQFVTSDTGTPKPPPANDDLTVDGVLGPKTISKWQKVMGTPVDGVISVPYSDLVFAVQKHMKEKIGRPSKLDGTGIFQNNKSYETVAALQKYLGTPVDYVLSLPTSVCVKALQSRLNQDRF